MQQVVVLWCIFVCTTLLSITTVAMVVLVVDMRKDIVRWSGAFINFDRYDKVAQSKERRVCCDCNVTLCPTFPTMSLDSLDLCHTSLLLLALNILMM